MTTAFDSHKNLAYSAVATAPSPSTSGTSLAVTSGDGAKFPAPPFNAVVWPGGGATANQANAEVVRVIGIATDTMNIARGQEGTTALALATGYQIALTATAKAFTDLEAAVNATLGGSLSGTLPNPGLAAGAATGAALGADVATLAGSQALTNKTLDNTSNVPVRVAAQTLGAAAASITVAVPAGYRHLEIEAALRSDSATTSQALYLRFNGDGGNNYSSLTAQFAASGSAYSDSYGQPSAGVGTIPAANGLANAFGPVHVDIPGYAQSGILKSYQSEADSITGLTTGAIIKQECSGWWNNTAAITSVTLLPGAGNLVAGSAVVVYAIP